MLRAKTGSKESEHLLHLLGGIFLVPPKNIGFGAFGVSKLMNMGLDFLETQPSWGKRKRKREVKLRTIVP